jgi:hypothetical protein
MIRKKGKGEYLKYPDVSVTPGRSYWFWVRKGLTPDSEGIFVNTEHPFNYFLKFNDTNINGWNMIGCPNGVSYRLGKVEIEVRDTSGNVIVGPTAIEDLSDDNPYIVKKIYRWNQGEYISYSDSYVMKPYEGYWVKAKKSGVSLIYRPSAQVGNR